MKARYNVICWQDENGGKVRSYKRKGLTLLGALLYIAHNIGKYPMMWVER